MEYDLKVATAASWSYQKSNNLVVYSFSCLSCNREENWLGTKQWEMRRNTLWYTAWRCSFCFTVTAVQRKWARKGFRCPDVLRHQTSPLTGTSLICYFYSFSHSLAHSPTSIKHLPRFCHRCEEENRSEWEQEAASATVGTALREGEFFKGPWKCSRPQNN